MHALLARAVDATARAVLLLAAAAGAATAQVSVAYYTGTPDPATFSTQTGADFGGLSLACTANVATVWFPTAATLAGICGGPNATVDGFGESARFLGAFVAPAAGSYTFRVYNDDGFALFVNGTLAVHRFFDDYQPEGLLHTVQLQAGVNPFQIDYYANNASFSFVGLDLPSGVAYGTAASTVPEPATVALLGGGLVVLGAVAGRRRRSGAADA